MNSQAPRSAWIEVDLSAVTGNIAAIRKWVGKDVMIMGIVKADAYGHDMIRMAEHLLGCGVERIGISTLGEGIALREAGINCPLMTLGYLGPDQVEAAIEYNLIQTVFSYEMAKLISLAAQRLNKQAVIHIKIDTGMGRIGFLPDEKSLSEIAQIKSLPCVTAEGLFSHLAAADMPDKSHALQQIVIFESFREKLSQLGISFAISHICNSAGILNFPQAHYDLVRPGLLIFGGYPSDFVDKAAAPLKPALSLRAQLVMVKKLPSGHSVSYGCKFVTERETLVATLPLGYGDGMPYQYAAGGSVLINGRRAPIIGSICMDQLMVDITDIGWQDIGTEAVFIGRQGNDEITPEEIAGVVRTINYEILTNLSMRLPIVYK